MLWAEPFAQPRRESGAHPSGCAGNPTLRVAHESNAEKNEKMRGKKVESEPKEGRGYIERRCHAPEAKRSDTKGSENPRRESGSAGLASESTQSKKAEIPRAASDA